ncbi:KTSC domain-containing protein [Salisediminibacterium selenitireducens]|uniref:KTSC domain-containing protein n=1 Tax=Bacillus selenitireducens (strain ATCC 700615 / DSM 15326 / MLS10) TaxID=439292 RepID=D6XT58_BACIE|nr:KTSC domain-containing protein [Salisediminibacterium selenitireducens]ADH98994.1 hypothetical protein Bsel_1482 [[Bacillus] selenitireducens MLS10]
MEQTTIRDGYFDTLQFDETNKQLHVRFSTGKYALHYEVNKFDYIRLLSSNNMRSFYENTISRKYPPEMIKI